MKYQKRVSVGAFLKKGVDIKDGDLVEIANEGKEVQGEFGIQNIFLIKLADGREGNVGFNQTSINNMIDAFGEDSLNWIGKKAKAWIIRSNVQGKIIPVLYISHPDAELSDEGTFSLPTEPKKKSKKDVAEDEINAEDIPY